MVKISAVYCVWVTEKVGNYTAQKPAYRRRYEYVNPAHVVHVKPTVADTGRRATEITITMGPRYTTIVTYEPVGSVARRLTLTTPST